MSSIRSTNRRKRRSDYRRTRQAIIDHRIKRQVKKVVRDARTTGKVQIIFAGGPGMNISRHLAKAIAANAAYHMPV